MSGRRVYRISGDDHVEFLQNLGVAYLQSGQIEQGIGVYFTGMVYGRVGMAILEDRNTGFPDPARDFEPGGQIEPGPPGPDAPDNHDDD